MPQLRFHHLLLRHSRCPPSFPFSSSTKTTPVLSLFGSTRRSGTMAAYSTVAEAPRLLFRQLFEKESSTYTYLLADLGHPDKPAVLVDPVDKTVDRDLTLIKELGLKLLYAMNTHVHADHVTGTGMIKGKMPGMKSVISKASNAKADLLVEHDGRIYFGNLYLEEDSVHLQRR